MFRFTEDRMPVAIILAISLIDFLAYFFLENLWVLALYPVIFILIKGCVSAWNHHHQHTPTFHLTFLNRVLEFFYALQTGVTTNMWMLHHNLGHHLHFLDQKKDESGWMKKNGKKMSSLAYTFNVTVTAHYRAFKVGCKFPELQKQFVFYTLLTFLIVGVMTWYHPIQALFVFIIPMVVSLIFTVWVTYGHHAGLNTSDEFGASYNNMNKFFNLLTGNLGYHTAHHHKQGVHWSRLPALHDKIKSKIPEDCYV
jgi:fatty acid desaturase